jgi:redox-sensitive bicupin YhaK (pirin superfamily)
MSANIRKLQQVIQSIPTSDGAGVRLRRSLGQSAWQRLDPFLMLDEFSSENANDYIAGFPSHPHRGFETVTYMLDGHMQHQDHLGNKGDLTPGSVQWMTAGRGIIHSEMPQQESGRMRGFQLWVNLPAKEKMKPASYQDIPPAQIPTVELDGGVRVKVIAGLLVKADGTVDGPVQGISTDPLFFDVILPAGATFSHPVGAGHNVFLYPYEGSVTVAGKQVPTQAAGVLANGDAIEAVAGDHGARFILLAAKPLNEPIVQYGPFVMNTREEIEQAIRDYQMGVLTQAA